MIEAHTGAGDRLKGRNAVWYTPSEYLTAIEDNPAVFSGVNTGNFFSKKRCVFFRK